MAPKVCFLGAVRRRTMICCRNVKISASSAARDRNRSTTAQTMSLKRSLITEQHRPILDQLLVRLSLRQGQVLSHLQQPSATIRTVNQTEECPHDRTPLLINAKILSEVRFRLTSRPAELVSSDGRNGFRAPTLGPGRTTRIVMLRSGP